MKKTLALFLCLGLLFGCSSNGEQAGNNSKEIEKEENKTFEIVESGYTYSGDGFIKYGVKINNPNSDKAIDSPTFKITSYDKDGKILSADDQTLFYIGPDETIFYGFLIDTNGKKPAKVEFKPIENKDDYIEPDDSMKSSNYKISNTNEVVDDWGLTSYTGEIEKTSETASEMVAVTVILRKDDKIVYGDTTFVDGVVFGNKTAFEIMGNEVPEHTSYEIYAQTW